jgi:guanylate kinase
LTNNPLVRQPIYIFIAPPSQEELEKRLRGRGTETEDAIKTRLGNAAKELEYGRQAGNFDRIFVNADLKATFEDLATAFKEWFPHLNEVVPEDEAKNCACVIS